MLLFLFLGFLAGAALVGGVMGWQRQRTLRRLQEMAAQVEAIRVSSLYQRLSLDAKPGAEAPLLHSLNNLLTRLQNVFESQRSFVINASHKLRTPLTMITGQIEVTLIKARTAEEHEQTWRSVLQDISRLNQLSNDLLELAQLSADRFRLVPQTVALDEVIYQAGAKLKARRPSYQVKLEFAPQLDELDGPLTVPGDAHLLEQAFLHLLENGCKFSPDRQVRVELGLDAEHAVLQFQDHGSGIAAPELPRIFEPFFRGANARQVPGHGIGLALVQGVVQLHQGSIEVAPAPEVGTTFIVRLPL
ncbi:sensor histidine kinase [Hymenobacter jejuensis]|uniref:histidine kinase n=1 Tax=Hymenobacter jejuensis TaxID=2502781 RepID=A0A5B8A551_9BACT|nr:HAMP domain-containing sensor histidine kinase [Hymenobacter jejuensis]QDA61715.1 HAMP domain-containing histidine kinase [Hymenobacter jejuensis]